MESFKTFVDNFPFLPHILWGLKNKFQSIQRHFTATQRRFFWRVRTDGTLMVLVLRQHTRWSKDGMSLPTASPPCCKRLGNASTLRITGKPAIYRIEGFGCVYGRGPGSPVPTSDLRSRLILREPKNKSATPTIVDFHIRLYSSRSFLVQTIILKFI